MLSTMTSTEASTLASTLASTMTAADSDSSDEESDSDTEESSSEEDESELSCSDTDTGIIWGLLVHAAVDWGWANLGFALISYSCCLRGSFCTSRFAQLQLRIHIEPNLADCCCAS